MFKNFLKVTLRNLWLHKTYSLINLLGMSVGITALVWGYQTYRFCFSFDNFQPDREQVFRAIVSKEGADGLRGVCPMPMVQAAKADFASIAEVVRLDSWGINIKADQSESFFQQAHFTDPAFFELFNFPGNDSPAALAKILEDRSAVLITEEMAAKFFGKENPLGKTLLFYAGESWQMPLTVRGVLKNPPVNSSIWFQFLTHFDNMLKPDGSHIAADDWSWFLDAAFFKIPNAADATRLAVDFKKFLPLQNAARKDFRVTSFVLEPMTEVANHPDDLPSNGLRQRPNDSGAYGPFILGILIFLSACLNFANTTVARSNRRLKEMGVRKVMGGTSGQLMRQVLFECGAIVVLATLLSTQINAWWLPFLNSMFEGLEARADYFSDSGLQAFMGLAVLGTTFLAGGYPAFYISRFDPTMIFRGAVKFGGSNLFSRVLLGFQVIISLITVIAAMAFSQNGEFQRAYDFGYDRENVMAIYTADENSSVALQDLVRQMPSVAALAGCRHHIGFGYRQLTAEAKGEKKETAFMEVGEDYLATMRLKTVAGRGFEPSLQSDFENALLVSQHFAGMFGWKDSEAIGQQVQIDTVTYSVVGTLRDFHADDLFSPMEPVAIRLCRPDRFQWLVVAAKPGEVNSTFDQIKAGWAKLFPLKPFNGKFQNEIAAEAVDATTSIAKTFSWFAIVAILLTATGLFALVSLTVLKKMKEIAVRKVVGARPVHILALVNKGYAWIFLIASVIGCYGGWWLTSLLMDMIFIVNVGVGVGAMAVSTLAVFVVAGLTAGAKVWAAVRTNPAEVLKSE